MPKGHTNNPNGRPKGIPNKSTKEIRDFIVTALTGNAECLYKDFQTLEPKERLDIAVKLLPYVLPKQAEITVEDTTARNMPYNDLLRHLEQLNKSKDMEKRVNTDK